MLSLHGNIGGDSVFIKCRVLGDLFLIHLFTHFYIALEHAPALTLLVLLPQQVGLDTKHPGNTDNNYDCQNIVEENVAVKKFTARDLSSLKE